jgi:signal transduction histidine kinase
MPAEPRWPPARAASRLARGVTASARRWRSSLRLRYAITATVLAGAAFAAGGAAFITLYRDSLVANVDHAVLGTVRAVAANARHARLPDPIPMPVAAGVPRVQIISAGGQVIGGDPASAREPPMRALARLSPGTLTAITDPPGLPEHGAAVIVVRTASPAGPVTIVVSGSLDPAGSQASQALRLSALIGAVCLAVVCTAAWLAAGRTLRRVERLRAQVTAITHSGDLTRRVPEAGQDELAGLGSTLNEMLAALSRSAERQRRFVADAAHELRTPLAGLSASLDVALSHPETVEDGAWLAELRDGHQRLGRLINDLLLLARLDGHAPLRRQPVDLAGVVTDCARRTAPPGVELRAGPIWAAEVCGDESQLGRVVTNLVDNALRHARSTVAVSLTTRAGFAVIAVADDGPGVPPGERERIWGRFVRLDHDRSRASGGSGLGLALVKELVEAHDGTVCVTGSGRGSGAAFLVSIPLSACGPGGAS